MGARCVFGNQLAYALVNRETTEWEAAMNNDFGLFLFSSFCCAFWLVGLFRRVRHVLQPIAADRESANETKELKDWLRLGATQLYLRSASVYVYLFWGALVISFLTSSLGGLELGQELFGAQSGTLETLDEFRIFFIVFTLQMIQLRSFDLALKETRCGGFYRLNFAAGVLVYAAMASVSITFAMACWLTNFGILDGLALAESQDNARDFQNELGALSDAVAKIESTSAELSDYSEARATEEEQQGGTCGKSTRGEGPLLQLRRDEKDATNTVEENTSTFAKSVKQTQSDLDTLLLNTPKSVDKGKTTAAIQTALDKLDRLAEAHREDTRERLDAFKDRGALDTTHPINKMPRVVKCPDQKFVKGLNKIDTELDAIETLTESLEAPVLFDNHSALSRWLHVFELVLGTSQMRLSVLALLILCMAPLTDIVVLLTMFLRAYDRRAKLIIWLNTDPQARSLSASVLSNKEKVMLDREAQRERHIVGHDLFAIARKTHGDALDELLNLLISHEWAYEARLMQGKPNETADKFNEAANEQNATTSESAELAGTPSDERLYCVIDHMVFEVLRDE